MNLDMTLGGKLCSPGFLVRFVSGLNPTFLGANKFSPALDPILHEVTSLEPGTAKTIIIRRGGSRQGEHSFQSIDSNQAIQFCW